MTTLPQIACKDIYIETDGIIPDISFLIGTDGVGLLSFSGGECTQLFDSNGAYGITKRDDRWFVSYNIGKNGYIGSFKLDGYIKDFKVEVKNNLSRKVHQIDFIGDSLFVTDTLVGEILVFDKIPDRGLGKGCRVTYPAGQSTTAHFNSIYKDDAYIYALAHNKSSSTGRNSELYLLDDKLNVVHILDTKCRNAHNIFIDENYSIICDSYGGHVYNYEDKVFESEYFTRGLSVSDDYIIVGGSTVDFDRNTRRLQDGKIFIFDRSFNLIGEITIPGNSITEIRRTDAVELTLSNT